MAKEAASLIPDAAVKAIQDSTKTEIIVVADTPYVTREVFIPPPEPLPDPLAIHTLGGFCDFVLHEADAGDAFAIHVVDHKVVRLVGVRQERQKHRAVFAQAQPVGIPAFSFGQFFDAEEFIIRLQTCFVPSLAVDQILAVVGNISDESVKTAMDDGVSQKVTTRKGISLGEETKVPNPVRLSPYRTFAEIEQPSSLFVLRLRRCEGDLPDVALFEIGDLAWQLEAIKEIRTFITERVEGIPVIA